jgi:beta-phosphoglucomutase-like phosphatase (HAD superfamily)
MTFSCGIIVPINTKALIFDMDGTLLDSMYMHIEAWQEAGQRFGIVITEDLINANAGTSTYELIIKLSLDYGWDVDPYEFTKAKQEIFKRIKTQAGSIRRIEPIIEIAEYYKGKLPMAVGTGSSREGAISALEDSGLIHLFDNIVTADDVAKSKPDPEVFMQSAEKFNVHPSDCLVFEDGDNGILSAIAAGMAWIDVRKYLAQ